jgi:2-dehydro-3-deoxyphosphogluconate aldolase/(4S)-4-hydroxy-2-oxoglutarate aldolase
MPRFNHNVGLGFDPEMLYAAETVYHAGITVAEITMTVPGAIDLIRRISQKLPDMVVGAGTVLDKETAARCIDAGAAYLTSTGFVQEVVDFAISRDVVFFPGALTPTEVIAAWKTAADFVKIFPAAPVGGDQYIHSLEIPLPQIPRIAAGGVNQLTAANFIRAGASAVGVDVELTPKEAIRLRQDHRIHELARRFVGFVAEGRSHP